MDVDIRPCASAEEVRQAISPIGYYFGRSAANEDQTKRFARVLPVERVYAAWEGGRAVGGLAALPLQLTVPGGRVPAAGVTVAGVLPTHRRRGLLRAMMRASLGSCRTAGEPVAYLWASEDTIYGRFGFGRASFTAEIDLPRERSAFHARFAASGNVRLAPLATAEEYVAPVYERVASVTPGMFARSSPWWQDRTLADPEWLRGGRGKLQCAVLEHEERPTGYALYRMNWAFERGLQAARSQWSKPSASRPRQQLRSGDICWIPTGWHASKPGFCRSIIRCCCWRRSRAGSASAFVMASGYGCSTRRRRCRRDHIRTKVPWSSR